MQIYLIIFGLIFIINPFLSVLLLLLLPILYPIKEKEWLYTLFILLAIYMGPINSTKGLAGDYTSYYDLFKTAKDLNLYDALLIMGGKEIVYCLLNYLGALLLPSFKMYAFVVTVAIYLFMYLSIYKYYKSIEQENTLYIISAVFILTFFTQFFNLTTHLLRQELANAIMMYVLVVRATENKINWPLIIASVFIHTTMLFFVPILLFPAFRETIRGYNIVKVGGVFLLLAGLISNVGFFASLFSFSETLSYGFKRLNVDGGISDGGIINFMFLIIVLCPLLIIALKQLYFSDKSSTSGILLSNALLILAILVLGSTSNPLIQYRFFYMSYAFMPFLLPLAFKKGSMLFSPYLIGISLFFFFRFYRTFDDIPFPFAPVEHILTKNILYYM